MQANRSVLNTTTADTGRQLYQQPTASSIQHQLIGQNPGFCEAIAYALRAAKSSAPVLIRGESGTGKELVAQLVHEQSPRATRSFVAVNCSAIPRELVESELFGHERGAFTGAIGRRLGFFEQAQGGTLFLDEIGELPREQQARLLRVLETNSVRRVGGDREHPVDVRIIAATHRDLETMMTQGTFRLDLYHRLCIFAIYLPPLRERTDDIPLLVSHLLKEASSEYGQRHICAAVVKALAQYPWPGNIRELRNAIRRSVALSDDELKIEDLLPHRAAKPYLTPQPLVLVAQDGDVVTWPSPRDSKNTLRDSMKHALSCYRSHRRAAQYLGIPKSTFYDRAKRLGLIEANSRKR